MNYLSVKPDDMSSSSLFQDLKNENERLKAELKQMLENYSIISKKCDSLQKERDELVKEKLTKYQYQCSHAMATCDGLYNMPQHHQPPQ